MDVGARSAGDALQEDRIPDVILLDTSAVLWLHRGHRRARPLLRRTQRLYASPASLLELKLLTEIKRLRLRTGANVRELIIDDRWLYDEPPADAWFSHALDLEWTRDPFDRLLAAHALLRNWRLATADDVMLEHLPSTNLFEL